MRIKENGTPDTGGVGCKITSLQHHNTSCLRFDRAAPAACGVAHKLAVGGVELTVVCHEHGASVRGGVVLKA